MAHNPHAPQGQGPEGHDPAGNTQMFRAFVDEAAPQSRPTTPAARPQSASRVGPVIGIVAAVVVVGILVAVAALALV
ncbi:hypothetical protein ACIHCQ_03465 [Streptomyces sp. NPDC052236]|uniref:hypothetical protein n=1 Tax=Streptomyces sp. NPDC052236 TaxID=3365686 RepID=UPI0037D140AA